MTSACSSELSTAMTSLSLLRLAQLSDSGFPSGGFAFSGGLETLVQEGAVADDEDVEEFLIAQVLPRWMGIDRWFLQRAHVVAEFDDSAKQLTVLDVLCEAHNLSAPLSDASARMGRAVLTSAVRIGIAPARLHAAQVKAGTAPGHLPVVQGMLGRALEMPLEAIETAALHSLLMGTLSAAVRMGKMGALGAQAVLLRLGPLAAAQLKSAPKDAPAAFCPLAEIAAARRSRLTTTLFSA